MSAAAAGTEEKISGTIDTIPDTGSAMKACVTATNIADLSTFVCSEEIYYDASPPRLNKLWLRHTLTGRWIQPCCIGSENCGSYGCATQLPSNATYPEFKVEMQEWPPASQSNFSKVKWTVRNVPMYWVDEDFEDLGFENILSTVWATNCTAQAWGCLQVS